MRYFVIGAIFELKEYFDEKIQGDVIALGMRTPKYRWIYEIKYNDEKEYIESLEKMIDKLCKRKEYIKELMAIYDEVYITIYIRSEFAQIEY